jgi:hypothetical protein
MKLGSLLHDPETKEQSKGWGHGCFPSPKKFKTNMSSSKLLASVFWDKNETLLVNHLEKGATIKPNFLNECCYLKTILFVTWRPLHKGK